MMARFSARLLDWLIAIFIVCGLLWFLVTQPLLSVPDAKKLPAINQSNLESHVFNLTQSYAANERVGSEALTTDQYILNYFSRLGKPVVQSYSTMGGQHKNIRLKLGPKSSERVVIGVQYLPPTDSQKQYWNPSGIAVMLETARVLSHSEMKLPISVEFVAFASAGIAANGTLEMGSFHHARLLHKAGIDVKLMIALQSVGVYRDELGSQQYPFAFMRTLYPSAGSFIGLSSRLQDFSAMRLLKSSFVSIPSLPVESFSAPENFSLVAGSDQANYWLYDYPAVQVSDLLALRTVGWDETVPLTLNYGRMAQVSQALFEAVRQVSKEVESAETGYISGLVAKVTTLLN